MLRTVLVLSSKSSIRAQYSVVIIIIVDIIFPEVFWLAEETNLVIAGTYVMFSIFSLVINTMLLRHFSSKLNNSGI